MIRILAILLLLPVLLPIPAAADYYPLTKVTVRVRQDGAPVEGAKIVLTNGNLEELYTATGPGGTCTFSFQAPEAISFVSCWIEEEGPVWRRSFNLEPGNLADVDFDLSETPAFTQPPETAVPTVAGTKATEAISPMVSETARREEDSEALEEPEAGEAGEGAEPAPAEAAPEGGDESPDTPAGQESPATGGETA